jgi:hypothetical protein
MRKLIFFAVLAVAIALLAIPAAASPPGGNGRIVFARFDPALEPTLVGPHDNAANRLCRHDPGHRQVDNAILAHRLCNRIDYSISVGRSHARDLEKIRKAREEAIRRNNARR